LFEFNFILSPDFEDVMGIFLFKQEDLKKKPLLFFLLVSKLSNLLHNRQNLNPKVFFWTYSPLSDLMVQRKDPGFGSATVF